MASDTYTPAQASRILEVSERRVRQLVSEGKLDGRRGDDGVVHISQRSVNEERKRRKGSAKGRKAAPAKAAAKRSGRASGRSDVDVDQLAEKVASAVGQRIEGQIEITRRAESLVRQELDEERARRMEAEAKLAESERRIAELEAGAEQLSAEKDRIASQLEEERSRKRGLFRR
jgi:hypothetical protein